MDLLLMLGGALVIAASVLTPQLVDLGTAGFWLGVGGAASGAWMILYGLVINHQRHQGRRK